MFFLYILWAGQLLIIVLFNLKFQLYGIIKQHEELHYSRRVEHY